MTNFIKRFRSLLTDDGVILGFGILLALGLRVSLLEFVSRDFTRFTSTWYMAIREQGYSVFGTDIYNYSPPYLYMLYLISIVLPGVSALTAVKLPSLFFDFVCAGYIFRIVRLRYENSPLPLFAFFAVLLAPTVVLNGSLWGQADSIYTAMLVACVYYLMVGKGGRASLTFGAAFAVKLQAIFLAPLLLVLLLKRILSWKNMALIPLVYLAAILPAWIAGRPLGDLFTIYLSQSGTYEGIAFNVPNMYSWLPGKYSALFFLAGLIWTTCAVFIFVIVVLKSRVQLIPSLLTNLGMLSLVMMPYFLPKMHERYFFPAEVLSIAYGFYFPRYYFIPIALNLIAFFTYQQFLFDRPLIPVEYLALAMLVLLVIVARQTFSALYRNRGSAEV